MSVPEPALGASQPHSRFAGKAQLALLTCLLVILTLVAFYPAARLPFVNYDDNLYVTRNANVQSGVNREMVRWAFTTYYTTNWHPLTWLSHALDCQLFALDPAGPHVINLLIHTLNVVLLFWVLAWMTERAGRSAMVAGLFAVHPINVESVAWVAERKNLLSMLFFLLALCAYVWYARRPTGARFAAAVVLFALGLMAKPQIIMLPFILLLCDYWPLGRLSRHPGLEHRETLRQAQGRPWGTQANGEPRSFLWRVLEKLPLFALSAASALLTLVAHSRGAMRPLPLSYRVANALVCYLQYVKLAFWPSRLAVYYPHPLLPLRSWNVLAAFLFLILVTGTVIAERRRRYLPVGWFWFLITLVPMIGVVQVGLQGMADRYAYLPLIGIFLMTTWVLADWASGRRIPLAIQSAVAIVVLAALVVVTHQQLRYWRDSVTLWTHALEVTHHSTIAEVNLGGALLERGDTEQALEHFRAGTAIDPRDPLCNMYLARYAQMQNNLPEAIEGYRRVIAATQDPGLKARAYSNMGYAYRGLGDETEARKCFLAAGEPGQ